MTVRQGWIYGGQTVLLVNHYCTKVRGKKLLKIDEGGLKWVLVHGFGSTKTIRRNDDVFICRIFRQ